MKTYNDFTFVIQGPIHQNSIYGALNNYKDYTDNLIFSHWDTDPSKELLQHLTDYEIPHTAIANEFITASPNTFNGQNVYYQITTTLSGLLAAKSEYVLKLRSDQYFGNLEPIMQRIRSNPEKYVSANLHFRPDSALKYHPSDKLFGGKTEKIKKTFEKALCRVKNNVQPLLAGAYMYDSNSTVATPELLARDMAAYSYSNVNRQLVTQYGQQPLTGTIQILPGGYIGIVSEILIGTSFLLGNGVYPDPTQSVRIVKDHFDIVRVEDMGPYINKDGGNTVEHNSEEIHDINNYG